MTDPTDTESLLLVGKVWRAHGVQGEVKIIPETDDPERFEDLTVIYMGSTAATADRIDIESVRFQPTKRGIIIIAKLRDIDSREAAETIRSASVFARQQDLPPLEEGEFFLHDLIGLSAFTDGGDDVGTVDDVIEGPGQAILVIAREGKGPAMVPAVDEFVDDIDLEKRRIVIRPIEGLLD